MPKRQPNAMQEQRRECTQSKGRRLRTRQGLRSQRKPPSAARAVGSYVPRKPSLKPLPLLSRKRQWPAPGKYKIGCLKYTWGMVAETFKLPNTRKDVTIFQRESTHRPPRTLIRKIGVSPCLDKDVCNIVVTAPASNKQS